MEKIIETTFDKLEDGGYTSVTDFCRYLVSTGCRFEGIKVHVFRGEMLCLIVNDIYKTAKLYPTGTDFVKHRPDRYRKAVQSHVKAPYSDLNDVPATLPA